MRFFKAYHIILDTLNIKGLEFLSTYITSKNELTFSTKTFINSNINSSILLLNNINILLKPIYYFNQLLKDFNTITTLQLSNFGTIKNNLFIKSNLKPINKVNSSFEYDSKFNNNISIDNFINTSNIINDSLTFSSISFFDLFDFNFLKRERLYTKLKYSRSPAYDIVSGGAAAFFSAFIGFLISEKFGIELVDSGDFYIAFMYGVFFGLSLKPFLRIMSCFFNIFDLIKQSLRLYINNFFFFYFYCFY